ncbi:MAG: hypothetical protein F6K50_50545, partial [Moorea sp. SIO3I7]|nr:hypothetical protein [Moorena sp. SIO3I7]
SDHEYSTTLACGRVKTTQELSKELQELHELRTLLVQSQQLQDSGILELQETQTKLQQTQEQLQQTQKQLQQTQEQLQHANAKVELGQTKLQQTQEQLQNAKVQLVQSQQLQESKIIELQQIQDELHHTKLEVAAMKTSKFWKMRSLWFKFKGFVGLPTDNE